MVSLGLKNEDINKIVNAPKNSIRLMIKPERRKA